jgi:hypothetical protein
MPIMNLAEEIARYLPGGMDRSGGGGGAVSGIATAGVMGGLLGSLLGDN